MHWSDGGNVGATYRPEIFSRLAICPSDTARPDNGGAVVQNLSSGFADDSLDLIGG
jgi:hypothetical protein